MLRICAAVSLWVQDALWRLSHFSHPKHSHSPPLEFLPWSSCLNVNLRPYSEQGPSIPWDNPCSTDYDITNLLAKQALLSQWTSKLTELPRHLQTHSLHLASRSVILWHSILRQFFSRRSVRVCRPRITLFHMYHAKLIVTCQILGLRGGVAETSILRACSCASYCIWCPTFLNHYVFSKRRVPISQWCRGRFQTSGDFLLTLEEGVQISYNSGSFPHLLFCLWSLWFQAVNKRNAGGSPTCVVP